MSVIVNIKVLAADWCAVAGHIEFTTVDPDKHYIVKHEMSHGLTLIDKTDNKVIYNIDRESIMDLISTGQRCWSWPMFLGVWQGFSAGYDKGRDREEEISYRRGFNDGMRSAKTDWGDGS